MTRKHFAAIAATIKAQLDMHEANYEPIGKAAVIETAEALASTLASFNGNFDRARFLAACGI